MVRGLILSILGMEYILKIYKTYGLDLKNGKTKKVIQKEDIFNYTISKKSGRLKKSRKRWRRDYHTIKKINMFM
jgi:hypothetical protein